MSKTRRFPSKFFKSFSDDPILDEAVGVIDDAESLSEDDKFASIAAIFSSPFGQAYAAPRRNTADSGDAPGDDQARDYIVNSIFAPPDLREEAARTHQQLLFVKEQEETLAGLREVNALMRKGWRVANAYATGSGTGYKALVLLERPF